MCSVLMPPSTSFFTNQYKNRINGILYHGDTTKNMSPNSTTTEIPNVNLNSLIILNSTIILNYITILNSTTTKITFAEVDVFRSLVIIYAMIDIIIFLLFQCKVDEATIQNITSSAAKINNEIELKSI